MQGDQEGAISWPLAPHPVSASETGRNPQGQARPAPLLAAQVPVEATFSLSLTTGLVPAGATGTTSGQLNGKEMFCGSS